MRQRLPDNITIWLCITIHKPVDIPEILLYRCQLSAVRILELKFAPLTGKEEE